MDRGSGPALAASAHDYRWLLDRGYPDNGALKLVGDRYRLCGVERGMLYRGVFSSADSERRSRSLVFGPGSPRPECPSDELTVDGHNVLFTIWNCLAGRPIVAATDGFVRDIGGTRSRLPHDERFERVAALLCREIAGLGIQRVRLLLDDPLPWSRDHAAVICRVWDEMDDGSGGELAAWTEPGVDAAVAGTTRGLIATSDTAIIDRCAVGVVDVAGLIVLGRMRARATDMTKLCG